MENEPDQQALFELQGPDHDGYVWACSPAGRDVWCQNLGAVAKVSEVMSQWLRSINYDEVDGQAQRPLSRRLQERENKARRLAEQTERREQASVEEDDQIDRMIRRNIEDHGA